MNENEESKKRRDLGHGHLNSQVVTYEQAYFSLSLDPRAERVPEAAALIVPVYAHQPSSPLKSSEKLLTCLNLAKWIFNVSE